MRMNEGSWSWSCQNSFQPQAVVQHQHRHPPALSQCLRAHTSHTVIPHGPLAWLQRYPSGTNDITIAREREQTPQSSVASHSPAAGSLHTRRRPARPSDVQWTPCACAAAVTAARTRPRQNAEERSDPWTWTWSWIPELPLDFARTCPHLHPRRRSPPASTTRQHGSLQLLYIRPAQ